MKGHRGLPNARPPPIDSFPMIRYKPSMLKRIAPIFILFIATLACSRPNLADYSEDLATALPVVAVATATPTQPPVPTATNTPEPAQRVIQADAAILAGDWERAIEENTTALNASTDPAVQAAARYSLARARYRSGDLNGAIDLLNELINSAPEPYRANAHFLMGEINYEQELYAEAAGHYSAFMDARPGLIDAIAQERRGDALWNAGMDAEAVAAYQAAADAPQISDPDVMRIKMGQVLADMGNHEEAIRVLFDIYNTTANDYFKAQVNYLMGQSYMAMSLPDQAYARYQDSVLNYQLSYYAYLALIELVDAEQPVSELDRGLIDYYAGAYGVAIEAFNRYLQENPEGDSRAFHYKALSLLATGDADNAAVMWDQLITLNRGDEYLAKAYDEKAYVQWVYFEKYSEAAETLLAYVRLVPTAPQAPGFLYEAARIYERNNQLDLAAATWERLMNEYPAAEESMRGLFLAGVTHYRMGNYDAALTTFQRCLVLSTDVYEQSAAHLWIGKINAARGDQAAADQSWQSAAQLDPTGYYSVRAAQLLDGEAPLQASDTYYLNVDMAAERRLADMWVRDTFSVAPEIDVTNLGPLASDQRVIRAGVLWEMGLYPEAKAELENLRAEVENDPIATYRLMNHLLDLGFYRPAIFASRQVLTLAGMDDMGAFTAPNYFNHVRFGLYYQDIVVPAAQEEGLHPLLLYSVMRQESLFDGIASSSAGARGLMQIMPATGQEVASEMGYPENYTESDLYRPIVSIRLGTHYLARQASFFNGDLYAALAAYNGGPGNAYQWKALAGDDPDLFLEVVRAAETRTYITNITEFLQFYRRLYESQ